MVRVTWLLLCLLSPCCLAAQLSIIIDDVGNHRNDLQLLQLDPAITLSVLPSSPYAKRIAQQAQQQQREVMLHLPMQGSRSLALGPYGLSEDMTETAFKQRVLAAINDYPQASGLNNHMGSQLTQQATEMHWLMQVLAQQRLFFIDSRTHLASVAEQIAELHQVPHLRRHVFLDHLDQPKAINKQWQQALKLARKYGHAVLIAHPRDNSIALLKQLNLPADIHLVGAAQRIAQQTAQRASDLRLVKAGENPQQSKQTY